MSEVNLKKAAAQLVKEKAAELNAAINAAKEFGLTVEVNNLLSSRAEPNNSIEVEVSEVTKF
jgi:hypothetical protein